MPRTTHLLASLVLLISAGAPSARAEVMTASLPVKVSFSSRTSLRVSSEVLRFDVGPDGQRAFVVVDFSAAARTARDGELVLSVEPLAAPASGARDGDTSITFSGQGEGTRSGALRPAATSVAARWTGSGIRSGSLTFCLLGAAPGAYTVPLRFVLSTP